MLLLPVLHNFVLMQYSLLPYRQEHYQYAISLLPYRKEHFIGKSINCIWRYSELSVLGWNHLPPIWNLNPVTLLKGQQD